MTHLSSNRENAVIGVIHRFFAEIRYFLTSIIEIKNQTKLYFLQKGDFQKLFCTMCLCDL